MPSSSGFKQYVVVGVIVAVGLALAIAAFQMVRNRESEDNRDQFEIAATNRAHRIRDGLETSLEELHAIGSLFAASTFVDRQAFGAFVRHSLETNTTIQALEWIPRVRAEDQQQFETDARLAYPAFQFTERDKNGALAPVARREEYFPVYYLEPYVGNEAALGFDLGSSAARMSALRAATDSGLLTATQRITLVQGTADQVGFLVFLPVYTNGARVDTTEQRRANLAGFALGVFRIGDFVVGSEAASMLEDIDLEIALFDRSAPASEQLLHPSAPTDEGYPDVNALALVQSFAVGGRDWEIVIRSESATRPLFSMWQPWVTGGSVAALTLVLILYTMSTLRKTRLVSELVTERTHELQNANSEMERQVAERRSAEANATASERQTRAILETTVDAIITIDEERMIRSFNRSAERIFGYKAAEVIGRNVKLLMPDPYHHEHDEYVQRYVETNIPKIIGMGREVVGLRKDGTTFPMELGVSDVGSGERRLFTGIVRDVTERHENERMKEQFVSIVSHELRTPLTSIRGALGLVASGTLGALSDQAQRMVDIATSNTERLVRLINDILDIERLGSGDVPLEKRICESVSLMDQAVETVSEMASTAEVTISIAVDPLEFEADPDRIVQVVTNLLSNAIKFSEAHSTIDLTLGKTDDAVLIQAKDIGRGIPEDKITTIFERFQQVDASDSREKGGSGLGLSIAESIVKQHGGSIWVESELGSGSVFSFTIPLGATRTPERTQPSPGARTVLLCDDDPSTLDVVRALLESRGYGVITVSSGDDALAQAAAHQPDVILLDLMMPDPNGWETLAKLKESEATAAIPVVILSALNPKLKDFGDGDVADILEKPLDEHRMDEVLARLITPSRDGVRLLIVEDDPDLVDILETMFQNQGVTTARASSGVEAIKRFEEFRPHLILLDLMMPGGTGFTVVDWLRSRGHLGKIPLVVYTAMEVNGSERARLSSEKTWVFTKSRVTVEEIQERIMSLIESVTNDPEEGGAT